MSFDSTVGGASSNSYVSTAEADAYFALNLGKKATWNAVTDPSAKEALLQEATRLLDMYFDWNGRIATPTQKLRWPRVGAYDADRRPVADDVIPDAIKIGTYEFAFYVLDNNGYSVDPNELNSLRVGPIRLDFSRSIRDESFPRSVKDAVVDFGSFKGTGAGGLQQVKLVRT